MTTQKTDNICRLCLTVDDAKYSQLDDINKEALKAVVPELNLDVPANFVVCSKCSESIEDSFSLKTIISKNEDLIRLEKDRLKITDKVNINKIFKADAETGSNGEKMCRLCLNKNEGKYTSLNDITTDVLETCLSELDKDLTADPAICELCYKSLQDMHSFKTECLSIEKKIKSYCESVSEGEIDLHKVQNISKDEDNDFLAGFEVQDEEGGDIFDSIPSEIEITENERKRSASDSHDEIPSKKIKLNDEKSNIPDDELPHFNFHFDALYNPFNSDTVDEWLAKVDEIKVKQNWSDYITINKVLLRLKDLNELCTWFSNISDIMNWEEWKKKLINAFPGKDDYVFSIRRALDRKKKKRETFADYYNRKLELLETLKIVGENAVSCILGGVTNHVISSIGRVGQYKTPEELLVYFKSCDDKAGVESSQNSADNKGSEHSKQSGQNKGSNKTFKGKKMSKQMRAKLHCTLCDKPGHIAQKCWKTKIAKKFSKYALALSAENKAKTAQAAQTAQTNKDTKNKNQCNYCGKVGHKRVACLKRRREQQKQKQNTSPGSNNANMKTQSPNKTNKNKGPNRPNNNKGPNVPNINKGPNNPNTSKWPNKKNTNKGPSDTNINKSPAGANRRQRNRGPNRPNRNGSPNGPNRNRSFNGPNRNRSPNGPNRNRSPNGPNRNRSPNGPNRNRSPNELNIHRGPNEPNMNRGSNGPNINRNPNPPNMSRNSNSSNLNRGLSDIKCAYCGNFGHITSSCVLSNFGRPSDTQSQYQSLDRQTDRYFSSASGGRDVSGQSYVGSYSNQKQPLTNRRLCLDCYQIGHETKDCPRYARKPYAR